MASVSDCDPLGIIAGRGDLPLAVAEAADEVGRPVFILGVVGTSDPRIEKYPHAWVRSGKVGKTLELLKQRNCRDLVLIGPMDRPSLFDFRPDFGALKMLPIILRLLRKGDDGLLSGVVKYMEEVHGFHILPAEEIAVGLVAPEGVATQTSPGKADLDDIALGIDVVRKRGTQDLGQGAIVSQGKIIDVEDETGTDAMLDRVRITRMGESSRNGVLVKLPKPGQERRVDLPALGLRTVENAAAAGLAGIAYEADGALFADFGNAVVRADELNLFVVGLPKGTGEGTE
jgi:UDP-2,3-diacylglucosamine hydrolase